MLLTTLLKESNIAYEIIRGEVSIEISSLEYDSRKKMEPGVLFACMRGKTDDAHVYAPQAYMAGARIFLVEKDILPEKDNITLIKVENSRKAFAQISAAFFGNPARKLKMIGITGTKGKSTTSYMIEAIFKNAGKRIGVIGTIGAVFEAKKWATKLTTPDSYDLHKLLSEMLSEGCEYVVMEVSSIGLMMSRVEGICFDYAIYTNLSPDHIGGVEHESFDEYKYCKTLLFEQCNRAILNRDDEYWQTMLSEHNVPYKTFGADADADYHINNIACSKTNGGLGIDFKLNDASYNVKCMGKFNAYNAAAAIAVASEEGISYEDTKEALNTLKVVRGRVEEVPVSKDFNLIIDYAHNALSMESLLLTIKEYNPKRIICVFGAGGNRSKLRRYDMGEIAGRYADLSILTADNPRDEEVLDIIDDIIYGMNKSDGRYIIIEDRREAIKHSIVNARKGDIIALIGKGHEDYQEIKGVKHHFDEREVIKDILCELEYTKL